MLQDKLAYIVSVVEQCWGSGRPVLIGTSSVNESELVLRVLQDWCSPAFRPLAARVQLLNAKPENVRLEAQVRRQCHTVPGHRSRARQGLRFGQHARSDCVCRVAGSAPHQQRSAHGLCVCALLHAPSGVFSCCRLLRRLGCHRL